jgi:hypothetical protein
MRQVLNQNRGEHLCSPGCSGGTGLGTLTQHPELQLPGVHPSAVGGLTAVCPSVGGLNGFEVHRALWPPTLQGHPILGPAQLGLWVTCGCTVQIESFSCQHLQDPRARLYLRGDWRAPGRGVKAGDPVKGCRAQSHVPTLISSS